jgi:hypothetical protein
MLEASMDAPRGIKVGKYTYLIKYASQPLILPILGCLTAVPFNHGVEVYQGTGHHALHHIAPANLRYSEKRAATLWAQLVHISAIL